MAASDESEAQSTIYGILMTKTKLLPTTELLSNGSLRR